MELTGISIDFHINRKDRFPMTNWELDGIVDNIRDSLEWHWYYAVSMNVEPVIKKEELHGQFYSYFPYAKGKFFIVRRDGMPMSTPESFGICNYLSLLFKEEDYPYELGYSSKGATVYVNEDVALDISFDQQNAMKSMFSLDMLYDKETEVKNV